MTDQPLTDLIAAFASKITYEDIPCRVIEHLKMLLVDLTGVMLRAGSELPAGPVLAKALGVLGMAGGGVRALSRGGTFSAPVAALFDGMAAHGLDFDDTHTRASAHPGAPNLAAGLAAAQLSKADGRTVLAGIVSGYEVQIRLSLALVPAEHYARGHALTATCGTFGAAATAGRILGLTPRQMAHAFGICCNQAAGSLQFLEGGTWAKPFQVGHAAFSGVMAAGLASAGFEGAERPLEGRYGFLRNYSANPVFDNAIDGLGEHYETLSVGIKPYPVCRYAHAAMDALIDLKRLQGIEPGRIRSVTIGLGRTGWNIVGTPPHGAVRTSVEGQFSMHYCAAVVLLNGRMTWDDLHNHLKDPEVRSLCERIEVRVDSQFDAGGAEMGASVAIETDAGKWAQVAGIPRGDPDNLLCAEDLAAKFNGLVLPIMDEPQARRIAATIQRLEGMADMSDLFPGAAE